MIIDIHTHVDDLRDPETARRTPLTFENLIARLDEEGIDKAVLLPLGPTPESIHWYMPFFGYRDPVSLLQAATPYADRIIRFGVLDPRMGMNQATTDFSWILQKFVDMGCVGIGEVTANIEFDDARTINMFRQCGERKLPLVIHGNAIGAGGYGLTDAPGSPHLERLLEQAPGATIIGHGPGFWSEIGSGLTLQTKPLYQDGPIVEEGSLWRLLRSYPNLYADTSARSGYTALTRDEAAGVRFLNEFQDKIVFGTDVCFGDAEGRMPHLALLRRYLAEGKISQAVFDKITGENATRILDLGLRIAQ